MLYFHLKIKFAWRRGSTGGNGRGPGRELDRGEGKEEREGKMEKGKEGRRTAVPYFLENYVGKPKQGRAPQQGHPTKKQINVLQIL